MSAMQFPRQADVQIYLNPYDQGKRRNLEFFFNVGPEG